jgi:putative peptidoglycan lipid II flippase
MPGLCRVVPAPPATVGAVPVSLNRTRIARSAALVAGLTAASQVLGFVRDAVIAAVFGTSASLDAYLVAQGLMNLVLGLIAGAMAKAVVPPVARAVEDEEPQRVHRGVRTALTVTTVVLIVVSAIAYVGAAGVVKVLAPGFPEDTAAEAVEMTRVVLLATVLIAATNLLAGVAQAHGRFFWFAVQGIPFNITMIAFAALLGPRIGVLALAIGFVVGSALRLVAQLPATRAVGLRLRPAWAVRDETFREIVRLVPPLLVGSALLNVNTLVDRAVGSGEAPGTIAALNYGWRLVDLAEALLVAAVVTSLYPAFSALATPERRSRMGHVVARSLGTLLALLTPVVVVLTVVPDAAVVVIFGRGNFDATAIRMTSLAVGAFAVAIVAVAGRELVARAFYSLGDSRTPVLVAVLGMCINVAGDLTLGRWYGVIGLAASTSLSVVIAAVLLGYLLNRRHQALAGRDMAARLGRITLSAGAALAAATAVRILLGIEPARTGFWSSFGLIVAVGGATLGCYLLALRLLRAPELGEVASTVHAVVRRRGAD